VYNALIVGSYGDQQPVSVSNSHQDASEIFLSRDLGEPQRQIIKAAGLKYLIVDWRLTSGLPLSGIYYEQQEAGAFEHAEPIPARAFEKFDVASGVSRVFDSGGIAIYDVEKVSDTPDAP
jgi:hypothetical protein